MRPDALRLADLVEVTRSILNLRLLADSSEGRAKEQQLTGEPQHTPTNRGVRKGFVYERVRHVTPKSVANNPDIREGMSCE
jgi:adenine-specific DNA-methyltransferase